MKLDCYDLNTYLLPFWRGKEVYHETLLFVEAPLLYKPEKIVCVRDFALSTVYEEGRDYELTEEGKIRRLKGSKMPYFTTDEYYAKEPGQHSILVVQEKEGVSFSEERYFAFGEKDAFNSRQVAVSYLHNGKYEGEIPPCKKEKLPRTMAKLNAAEPFRFAFYGDSITTGCNASGLPQGGEIAPYMPGFDRQVCDWLETKFGSKIEMKNGAVGGWSSVNGKEKFFERIGDFRPDLILIGFGMNDGGRSMEEYKQAILDILYQTRESSPKCEALLLGTTLPNPGSNWYRNQALHIKALYEIEKEMSGVAVADMTAVHCDLLKRKRYRDMTGNNVNHPNDFLIRAYAQVILQTLVGR